MAVAKVFLIHQTLWELWLTKNKLVFQKQFKIFSMAKVTIFMVEHMKAICQKGVVNKRMVRVMRALRYIKTPADKAVDLEEDRDKSVGKERFDNGG